MTGKPSGKSKIPPTFGPWLQRLLTQRGWSKTKAAEQSGMGVETLTKLMKGGDVRVEVGWMEGIADAVNMDLGFVLHKAGFDIDADGVNMDRVKRVESVAAAYEEVETLVRSALTESAALLGADVPLRPVDTSVVNREIAAALLALDLSASRLRAEGYITYTSGAVRGSDSPVVRSRSQWTTDEDRMLVNSGLDEIELAQALGRPLHGIRARRVRLRAEQAREGVMSNGDNT